MSENPAPAWPAGPRDGGMPPGGLSIIVPAYNEEDNVEPLYRELAAVVPSLGQPVEILFVDDGSTDRTFERLAALAARDPRVRAIKLRRNCGQTPAMVAGIDHAQGDILITMDADLQNDPADIPALLDKIREGYDLVVGWRQDRKDTWLSRRLPSLIANWLIAKVTGVAVRDNGCTLKAFRAGMIKRVPLYAEMHRFIPAVAATAALRLAEIPVRHHPRRHGTSKYGLGRIYRVCFDLIVIKTLMMVATRPMLSFFGSALVTAVLGVVSFGAALYQAFAVENASAVVFMGVSLLLGSLALFLGLAGAVSTLVCTYGAGRPDQAPGAPAPRPAAAEA